MDRVETGVVQFGEDWPGVFIRGDQAYYWADVLGLALHEMEESDVYRLMLEPLRDLLLSASNSSNQLNADEAESGEGA